MSKKIDPKEEYTKENLEKAESLKSQHKNYSSERNLQDKIQSFEMHQFASNWIKKYKEFNK